jgi:hypothetical protein
VDVHLDKDVIDQAFEEFKQEAALSDEKPMPSTKNQQRWLPF